MKSRSSDRRSPSSRSAGAVIGRKARRLLSQVGVDLGLLPPRERRAQKPDPSLGTEKRAAAVRSAQRREQLVEVVSITSETPDALTFELRGGASASLAFEAGQFLSVAANVGRERLWRSYSMCTAPGSGKLAITVKRVSGGRVSNYLHDHLRVGTELEVRGPWGRFTLPAPAGPRTLVLLGAGSGMTPLMSHLTHALSTQPATSVALIYGNRSARDVIFAEALTRLLHEHPERLRVRHVLEELSDGGEALGASAGRLDAEVLERELAALGLSDDASHEYLICGPEPMMAAAQARLAERGVPEERVHLERFTGPDEATAVGAGAETHEITVSSRKGSDRRTYVARGRETLLEAAQRSGVDLDFSCQSGGCGACIVYLREGEVELDEPNCLTSRERKDGKILTCSARALGPVRIEKPH